MITEQPAIVVVDERDLFTYRRLRRAIGYLGVGLPVLLVLFSQFSFFKTTVQPSISHFYYTNLRELFTGTLCGVGLFLVRYKGLGNKKWWKNDNLLTNISGLAAFGVVLIPTNPLQGMEKVNTFIPYDAEWLGWFHYGFAAVLFISFSLLAICVFTLGQAKDPGIPVSAVNENNIYRFCGYSILVFISLVLLSNWVYLFPNSTLIFEALSLLAFGSAWLIKGRALGDKGKVGEKIYRERN